MSEETDSQPNSVSSETAPAAAEDEAPVVEAEAHPVEAEAPVVEAEAHPVEAEAPAMEAEAHPADAAASAELTEAPLVASIADEVAAPDAVEDASLPRSPEPEPEPAPEPVRTFVRRTVSQEIARSLHAAGARFCFTVPGESFLPLLDDLHEAGIRVVATRHEGGAAFMAEALAQATGRAQIVAVTRGVGATNAAIGIHTAKQDSAPLVALVGQVQRGYRGREAFQETDLVRGIGSLASWAAEISDPEETVRVLEQTWSRLMSGRPGPILLSLPQDVLSSEIEVEESPAPQPSGARGAAADRGAVRRILKWLAASERGVIVAGGGVLRARATKRLVAVSEALAVPVIASWRRPDVFPNDHANYLGMAGYWAASTVKDRLADADAILFIGTRMSEVTTFGYAIPGEETRWAHVDLEPRTAHAGLAAPTLAVSADASRFLDTAWSDLRGAALDNEMRERRVARNAADRQAFKDASDVGKGTYDGPGVHPGQIISILRAVLPDNAVISTDAGNLAGWAARGFRFRRAGTFLGPTSGAMGFGLPAAIAASLHDPDRIALAICGDGGFAMTMNELETAVREGAHPIAVVLDNERYGTIAMQQHQRGREPRATDLGPIDFAAAARSMGALGLSVTRTSEFEAALREAITSRQPAVIHVSLDRAWVSADDNPVASSA